MISADITKRKQAEVALCDSEARRRLALDAGHMGTWDRKMSMTENDKLLPVPRRDAIRPAWTIGRPLAYALAAALTLATLAARLALGGTGEEPLLELFLAPIIVSAYVGGLGPGLLATGVAAVLTNYILLPPAYTFLIASGLDSVEWVSLIVAGTLISVLNEGLHRARRRAEAGHRLQAVTLASIGDAVITTDAQGCVTFLNAEAERLTGWPNAEAVGQPLAAVFRIVNAQTRAVVEDPAAKVLRTGAVVGLANHTVLIARDGRETPIDDSGAPIRQADGAVEGVVLVFRDVAAREQAEATLRASEERFRLMVEGAQDYALFMLTPDGQVASWNSGAERIKGYAADEIVGQDFACFYTSEDVARGWPAQLLEAAAAEGYTEDAGWRVRKDGSRFWATVVLTALRDEAGQPRGFSKLTRDMTERQRAEAALRESQERLAGIVGSAMDAIISIDPAQRIVVFNAAAEQMFGCPTAAALGQPIDRFVPARFRGVHAAHVRAFGQTGVTSRSMHSPGNLTALRADGTEFPIEATISQTVAAGQPLYTVIIRDISARAQAEEQLHYQTNLLAQVSDAIISTDLSFTIKSWNAAAEALYGWPAQEVIGKPMREIVPTEYLDSDSQQVQALFFREERWQGEVTQQRRDGTKRSILSSASLLKDTAGKPAGAVAINRDITERKRAEQALRQSEERFAKAFRANPAAMSITRMSDGCFIDINASHERLFGYQRDELIGQRAGTIGIYANPDQRAEVVRIMREQGSFRVAELTLRTKSGELREVLCSLESLELDGEACMLGSVFDITERKRAEQALQRAAERLHVLADASRAFAEVGTDYQALLDQVARTTAAVLGEGCNIRLLSDDAVWLQLAALYDGDPEKLELTRIVLGEAPLRVDEPSVATRIFHSRQPLLMPVVDREQVRAATKPEYRSLVDRLELRSMIFVPMRVQGRAIGVLILYRYQPEQPAFTEDDLTLAQDLADRAALAIANARLLQQVQAELAERTKAEAEVRTLSVELEQRVVARTAELATANKELEAFSYSVSHDLRAPLRAIDGFSRILLEDYVASLPDEAQRYFELVRSNAQQMGRLIDDLLAFARLSRQSLSKRSVEPAELVRQCLDELHAEQDGQRVEISVGALPACQGDAALLKQVWINLLANALKYTRRRDPAEIAVASRAMGGETIYFVKDNGVGFDMRYSDKLFGVFQRMHRAEDYEGTGVGLAIVQRIIQRHGGRVWAEAEVDQGATFSFTVGGDRP